MSSFEQSLWVAATPSAVFDLSTSIDLHAESMAKSNERAIDGITEGHIKLGERVTWRARHFGVVFHMTSHIASMERPHRFVDEQVEGPFATWWHLHEFESVDGGTRMTDTIRYDVPFGRLGRLVDRVFLARYMVRLIERRNAYIKSAAETLAREPD